MTRAWPKLRRAVACRGNMQRRLAVLIEPDGCTCIPPSPADGPPSTRQRPADHISRASQGMHALCRRTNAMRGGAGGWISGERNDAAPLVPSGAPRSPRAPTPPADRAREVAGRLGRARAGGAQQHDRVVDDDARRGRERGEGIMAPACRAGVRPGRGDLILAPFSSTPPHICSLANSLPG
jgi:hypothetical protein